MLENEFETLVSYYLRPIHAVSLQFFYNLYSGISGSPELTADYDK